MPYADEYQDLLGLHEDVPNKDYHGGAGISKSTLDLIHKSIKHYLRRAFKDSPAMRLGTAVHSSVLEPDTWPGDYIRGPDCDMRSKAWKLAEEEAAVEGKELLRTADWDKVARMTDSVHSHPAAQALIGVGGLIESSLWWEDPETGILLKCRPDMWVQEADTIVDLKTTRDASPDAFAKSCGKFRYDVQDGLYTTGTGLHTNRPQQFIFIAVENEEPHNTAVYELHDDDRIIGKHQFRNDLETYAEYLQTMHDDTGYGDEINTISVPGYMRRSA